MTAGFKSLTSVTGLLTLLLALTFFMPPVPSPSQVSTILVVLAFATVLVRWILKEFKSKSLQLHLRSGLVRGLALLAGSMLFSTAVALLLHRVTLGQAARGLVPYGFLLLAPVAAAEMKEPRRRATILWALIILGVAASARNMWLSYQFTGGVMNAFNLFWKRVTLADPSTTIPYPLVGAVTAVVLLMRERRWGQGSLLFVLGAFSVTGFVITLTRSMELSFAFVCLALLSLMVWRHDWALMKRAAIVGLAITLAGIFVPFPNGALAKANLQRNVSQAAVDFSSGRGSEFHATTAWLGPGGSEEPDKGEAGSASGGGSAETANSSTNEAGAANGGTAVVTSSTAAKVAAILIGQGPGHTLRVRADGSAVPYVHNVLLWLFLDTGVLGLVVFVALVIVLFKWVIPPLLASPLAPKHWDLLAMLSGIVVLLAFANFFAVFRLIHFNIILALLLGGAVGLSDAINVGGV